MILSTCQPERAAERIPRIPTTCAPMCSTPNQTKNLAAIFENTSEAFLTSHFKLHSWEIIGFTPFNSAVLWGPKHDDNKHELKAPRVMRAWACFGRQNPLNQQKYYHSHFFATIATPTVLWRPLIVVYRPPLGRLAAPASSAPRGLRATKSSLRMIRY